MCCIWDLRNLSDCNSIFLRSQFYTYIKYNSKCGNYLQIEFVYIYEFRIENIEIIYAHSPRYI